MKKILINILFLSSLGVWIGTAFAATPMSKTYADTCLPKDAKQVFIMQVIASKITNVPLHYLVALHEVESKSTGHFGEPGQAITSMKMERDAFLYWVIATKNLYNPVEVCASKQSFYGGYGGAMGIAQFIPETWASYAGLTVTKYPSIVFEENKLFKPRSRHKDIALMQKILNRNNFVSGRRLVVDGSFGRQTQKALKRFQNKYMKSTEWDTGICKTEVQNAYFGGCSRVVMMLYLGDGEIAYDPEKNRILKMLEKNNRFKKKEAFANPWNTLHSAIATALYLKDLEAKNPDPRFIFGAYFAGPKRAYSKEGKNYWNKIKAMMPFAKAKIEEHSFLRIVYSL